MIRKTLACSKQNGNLVRQAFGCALGFQKTLWPRPSTAKTKCSRWVQAPTTNDDDARRPSDGTSAVYCTLHMCKRPYGIPPYKSDIKVRMYIYECFLGFSFDLSRSFKSSRPFKHLMPVHAAPCVSTIHQSSTFGCFALYGSLRPNLSFSQGISPSSFLFGVGAPAR